MRVFTVAQQTLHIRETAQYHWSNNMQAKINRNSLTYLIENHEAKI